MTFQETKRAMDSDSKRNSEKSGTVTEAETGLVHKTMKKDLFVSKTVRNREIRLSCRFYAFDKFQEIVEHILPYDALFYVLEGKAEVEISGKHYTVKAGEIITFHANKPHSISTKCKFKMLLFSLKE